MAENKVGFGLSKLYYAIATIDDAKHTAIYGAPKAFPGAVSLNLDPQGDRVIKRADNVDYWIGNANNGYEGDLEVARVSDAFLQEILGEVADDNGVQIELKDVEAIHFALMFQFEGDKRGTRHVLYNCTASRPSVAGKTTEETIDPENETVSIKASSIYNEAIGKEVVKAKTYENTDATTYDGWYDEVYEIEADSE